MIHKILVVDDDRAVLTSMKTFLEDEGFVVRTASDGDEALAVVKQGIAKFSVAIVDYHMPDLNGPALTSRLRELEPNLSVIGFSGDRSSDAYDKIVNAGAMTLVEKDAENVKLLSVVHRFCRLSEERDRPFLVPANAAGMDVMNAVGLVGRSDHIRGVAALVSKFAGMQQTVLIRGEHGTGKERVARALHALSPRCRNPFVAVNCGAIPATLLEAELFGHEKGSFTGASSSRSGKFMAANGGTILLDEIGEMPPQAQVALLRVLQEREITPVGSNDVRKVNVRVVAATNAALEEKMASGEFRCDLFYRLNVLEISLKPLRERPDDIAPLIAEFLAVENETAGIEKTISAACVEAMVRMPWRGNARELAAAVGRLHALSQNDEILESDLRRVFQALPSRELEDTYLSYCHFQRAQEQKEKGLILWALERSRSVVSAADLLGMPRGALRGRMRSLGLKNPYQNEEPNETEPV